MKKRTKVFLSFLTSFLFVFGGGVAILIFVEDKETEPIGDKVEESLYFLKNEYPARPEQGVYENAFFGFRFSFPDGWELIEDEGNLPKMPFTRDQKRRLFSLVNLDQEHALIAVVVYDILPTAFLQEVMPIDSTRGSVRKSEISHQSRTLSHVEMRNAEENIGKLHDFFFVSIRNSTLFLIVTGPIEGEVESAEQLVKNHLQFIDPPL